MSEDATIPESQAVSPLQPRPVTLAEKTAWITMAIGLYLILEYRLVASLLAGLLVHALIHMLARRLQGRTMSHHGAKLLALSMIVALIIGASAALVLVLLAFLHGKLGHLTTLLDHMAAIIESARVRYRWESWIPATADLKASLSQALRLHAGEIQRRGGELGRILVHALVGIVIGAIAAFETRRPSKPLAAALHERLARLSDAFERVVFAQVRISLLNTAFTATYLLVALPLFHVDLPLRKTLVLITFIFGLLPVLGNLLSNVAIVVVSLGSSAPAAIASLVYLVVIHKLEYFLNARIVGRQIRAAAWEILVAMVLFEAVFGIAGVIAAPILYAYAKKELVDRNLV